MEGKMLMNPAIGKENTKTEPIPNNAGSVIAVSISHRKGVKKTGIHQGRMIENFGLEHDAHAGDWHRQVSLLAVESINKIRSKGLEVNPGDFAENIATIGADWKTMPVGTQVRLGETALIEISQIGKECINKCAIYYQAGDCIMPREGVFARVLEGGIIRCGDTVEILS